MRSGVGSLSLLARRALRTSSISSVSSSWLSLPYLLVGHSLGGFYARHYAHRFPGEVAGLVLLDLAHEDYDESVSQGENWLVEGVGQVTLHLRRPDAVQQAIQDLLGRPGS